MGTESSTILIVDDQLTNRLKMSMAVKNLGYRAETANDGAEALLKLRSDTDFDLVLLDILMPEMDGHKVLASMKADDTLRDIPVIVISSLDEMESVITSIERGAEDYLPKNFEPALLKARISASIEKKQNTGHPKTIQQPNPLIVCGCPRSLVRLPLNLKAS